MFTSPVYSALSYSTEQSSYVCFFIPCEGFLSSCLYQCFEIKEGTILFFIPSPRSTLDPEGAHVCLLILCYVIFFATPILCSPKPDSSVPGILQARILGWVVIFSSM